MFDQKVDFTKLVLGLQSLECGALNELGGWEKLVQQDIQLSVYNHTIIS
jgi:hypothetical protein